MWDCRRERESGGQEKQFLRRMASIRKLDSNKSVSYFPN